MPVLTLAQSEELVVRTLTRCRTADGNAKSVARALVMAEAEGLKGHGLSRVPVYAAQAKIGKVDGFATPAMTRPKPSMLAVDAAHGFAYPAMDARHCGASGLARAQGVAVAAIRRSHHCGAAGHPVERLAEAGLVALMFANTPGAIAPWGGSKAVFGTNPIAFACPHPGAAPIVVDLSLSKVARGNIMAAKQRGEAIPDGWALDQEGKPTTDPDAALRGTMLPLGDAKGTALALMVELLAAGLTGSQFRGRGLVLPRCQRSAARHRSIDHCFRSACVWRLRRAGSLRGSGCLDRGAAWRAASRQPAACGARQGEEGGPQRSGRLLAEIEAV